MKKCLWGLAIVAGVWFVPGLLPLQHYLPQAEQMATAALGVPVKIGDAKLSLLPSPRLILGQIAIGPHQDVQVQSVAVMPLWMHVWQSPRLCDLVVDGVVIQSSALAAYDRLQAQMSVTAETQPASVYVRDIQVRSVDVRALLPLPLLDAHLTLAEHKLQGLNMRSQDGSVRLDLTPAGVHQQVRLQLQAFQLPSTRWVVNTGTATATLMPKSLHLETLALHLLGGEVTASGDLSWQQQAAANLRFRLHGLSMQQLTQSAGASYLTGQLGGEGTVTANAAQVGELTSQYMLQANLAVQQGVLHGLDLIKIAKLLVKGGAHGGETRFDTLQSQLKLQVEHAQFTQVVMSSGLMTAQGHLLVAHGQHLDGDMVIALKGSAGLLEVPLDIRGTLSDPVILPDKAATVGAAVGTMIMPGVGTGLGMKAGAKLKSWLGGE